MDRRDQRRADLEAHLARWDGREFDYRRCDCVRWTSEWALVPVVRDWKSQREAMRRLLERHERDRVADAVDDYLTRISVTEAQYGDIVALDTPPLDTLGICIGYTAVFLGPLGYVRRPRSNAFAAWRVER